MKYVLVFLLGLAAGIISTIAYLIWVVTHYDKAKSEKDS